MGYSHDREEVEEKEVKMAEGKDEKRSNPGHGSSLFWKGRVLGQQSYRLVRLVNYSYAGQKVFEPSSTG